MKGLKIGFALCGSFCTFGKIIPQFEKLISKGAEVYPIMSEFAYETDTRFGKAEDFIQTIEGITNKKIIHTIKDAEPIGPKKMFDVLVIAPCTGNTLSKLAHSIADTSVTMAAKAHMRNGTPLVIGVSTNDGLMQNAANLGVLLSRKLIYFVPFTQDDPEKKPSSLVADMNRIDETIMAAMNKTQLQPMLIK